MAKSPSRRATLLFCPFCRECFEDTRICPEHELPLIPFDQLPRDPTTVAEVHEETVLTPFDPRFGRGFVWGGALLALLAFFAPIAVRTDQEFALPITGFALATRYATVLWAMPLSAVVLAVTALRRRTPRALRGAHLALLFATLTIPASATLALRRVWRGAEQLSRPLHAVRVELGWGVWIVALATGLLLFGVFRLGVIARADDPDR